MRHQACLYFERSIPICGLLLQYLCPVLRISERQITFHSGIRHPFGLIHGLSITLDGRPFPYYCKQRALMECFVRQHPLHVHALRTHVVRIRFTLIKYVRKEPIFVLLFSYQHGFIHTAFLLLLVQTFINNTDKHCKH